MNTLCVTGYSAKGNVANVQQERIIQGQVTDQSGRPLSGASVTEKGTTNATSTAADGTYTLEVSSRKGILLINYVGYASQEIPIDGKRQVNVTMTEQLSDLDEVVVVGYGVAKKATLTSSVSTIKSEEIIKNTVGDVSNALAGKAPGIIARNWNAEPGADATTLYIRGVSTTGDNNPLIVVDGIPDRNMSLVDINDIESVTILKDASAVAPYGSRGANGVILITTKRGATGKPTISYNLYHGTEKPTRLPEYASSADYARMFNEASKNEGAPIKFSEAEIAKYQEAASPEYPNTQWWDEIIRKNPVQASHNVSVSGGGTDLKYYLSLGTFRQDGFFNNTDFERYNLRANIDANITKEITVSFDILGYSADKNRPVRGEEGYETAAYLEAPVRIPSIYPVRNADGQFVSSGIAGNPVALLEDNAGYNKSSYRDFNGSVTFKYSPSYAPGLDLKVLGVYDYHNEVKTKWEVPVTLWGLIDRENALYQEQVPGAGPSYYKKALFGNNKQLEFQANYSRQIGDHQLTGLFVFNRTEWDGDDLEGLRINYASSIVDQMFAGPSDGQSTDGNSTDGARMGYVGRLTYDYQQKYLFEGNFRYDGSMKFAKGKRWGFFPSFAAGWRISEEPFFKDNVSFIDNLKLRASWGQAGNDRVGDYQFLSTYGFQEIPYSFGGKYVQTAKESRLANPDITWETASMTDIGIDASLFGGLLTLEADYFHKKTTDILRPTQKASSVIGISLPDENIGIVENKGFEFLIGHRKSFSDFNYHANVTFTYSKNKAVEIAEAEGTLNDPIRRRTGRQLDAYYGYLSEGLFTNEEEIENHAYQGTGVALGDVKYRDINGPDGIPDGVIDGYDQTLIGYSAVPGMIFGLNLGASWKGFDLSMSFQGATKVNYLFSSYAANAFDNGGNIQHWQMEERWTPENNNPNARYPRLTTSPVSNNTYASDYWIRDGTYVRLRNIQLGYTFGQDWLKNIRIQNLRVFVTGQNLFTWVKDDLMRFDPEATNDRGQFYPQTKVYSVGLNLSF